MTIPVLNTTKYDRYFNAVVVAYKPDSLEIDADAYRTHVRRYTRSADFQKIKGALIVNPEAGEPYYMTQKERDLLIKIAVEERPPDMPVFSGIWGSRTDELISSGLSAKKLGADGLFVFPPVGTLEVSLSIDVVQNPEIWTNHVKKIAEGTQLPLILHPVNLVTPQWGSSLPIDQVKMLMEEVPSIVGYKMIYNNIGAHFRVARFLRTLPRHVAILNLPPDGVFDALMFGLVDGAVNGGLNFVGEGYEEFLLAWKAGDIEKAKRVWNDKVKVVEGQVYGNRPRLHIRYKLATWIRGFISHPFMRPPMPPPRRDEAEAIYKAISQVGLSCISRSEFESTFARKDEILAKEPLPIGSPF